MYPVNVWDDCKNNSNMVSLVYFGYIYMYSTTYIDTSILFNHFHSLLFTAQAAALSRSIDARRQPAARHVVGI
jgi:hypothetical protein